VIGFLEKDVEPAKPGKSKAQSVPLPCPPPAKSEAKQTSTPVEARVMPAAQRVMAERGIKPEEVKPNRPGRSHPERGRSARERSTTAFGTKKSQWKHPVLPARRGDCSHDSLAPDGGRTVGGGAENAALLTTFNEIDMGSVMSLRKEIWGSIPPEI
jgi:2-oxoglutarate dehydrogenase E2 component (dihydrolipoamide succinyltransferase)